MLNAEQIWRGHRSFISLEPIVSCDESGWAVVNAYGQELTARHPKKHLALTEYSEHYRLGSEHYRLNSEQ